MALRGRPLLAALALASLAAAAADAPSPAALLPEVPFFPGRTNITVCTTPFTPMVICEEGMDVNSYSGYEIELFRATYPRLGWTEDMLDWRCLTFDEAVAQTYAGECDVAVWGWLVEPSKVDQGITFTRPTFTNGLRILARVNSNSDQRLWFFLSAFDPRVWAALVLTSLGVGVAVWLAELATHNVDPRAEVLTAFCWDSVGRPTQTRDFICFSNAASILVVAYSLLTFILMSLYTASMASQLTANQLSSQIKSLADLPGKAVGTWEFYADVLVKYGVVARRMPWNNLFDEEEMLRALRNGTIDALVLDVALMELQDATTCDLVTVGDRFEPMEQATAFPPGFNNSALLAAYNEALIDLRREGSMGDLEERFMHPARLPCKDEVNQQSYHINFSDVAGLWIMLGIAAGCSVLLVLLHLWRHKWWPALRARPALRRLLHGACCCGWADREGGQGLPVRLPGLETMITKAGSALQSALQPHPSSSAASLRELDKQLSSASKASDDSAAAEPPRRLSTGVAARLPSARPPLTLSPVTSGAAYDMMQVQLAALTAAVEQLTTQVEAQQALLTQGAQQAQRPQSSAADGAPATARAPAPTGNTTAAERPAGRMSSMQRLMLGRVMRRYKDHASTTG